MQVFLTILRKTYGYNKKEAVISLGEINISTGINKPNCIRAIEQLICKNLIIKKDNENLRKGCFLYSINKDYETWVSLSKKIIRPFVIKKDNKPLSKKITTVIKKDNNASLLYKNNFKDNIKTKERILKYPKERPLYPFFLEKWNLFLNPKLSLLTNSRKMKIRSRLEKDKDFYTHFEQCIEIIKETNFLLGKNPRGWRATFDWLIKNDRNYIRVLEGCYSGKSIDQHEEAKEVFDELCRTA